MMNFASLALDATGGKKNTVKLNVVNVCLKQYLVDPFLARASLLIRLEKNVCEVFPGVAKMAAGSTRLQ